jgi:hypothetical protein
MRSLRPYASLPSLVKKINRMVVSVLQMNVLHRSLHFNDSGRLIPQLTSCLAHGVLTPLIATI